MEIKRKPLHRKIKSWEEILPKPYIKELLKYKHLLEFKEEYKKYLECFEPVKDISLDWHLYYEKPINYFPESLNKISDISKIKSAPDNEKYTLLTELKYLFYYILSIVNYKTHINVLYRDAKNGNNDSLFKLIKIDPSIICTEFVKIRIQKAEIDNDHYFFTKLSSTLKKHNKIYSKDKYAIAVIVGTLMYIIGKQNRKCKLSFLQICDFLCDNKFTENVLDYNDLSKSVRKFLKIRKKDLEAK
ncbi:MAG: hypothetical protein WC947_04250 [Elusimicrobiota bacterium]